jgi:hypothetical protein
VPGSGGSPESEAVRSFDRMTATEQNLTLFGLPGGDAGPSSVAHVTALGFLFGRACDCARDPRGARSDSARLRLTAAGPGKWEREGV